MADPAPDAPDHGGPADAAPAPGPLRDVPPARMRSAAEEARTILASTTRGTLATLAEDGGPWASMVLYGLLPDGAPVVCVSTLAEHGRSLRRDPRVSLAVNDAHHDGAPLAGGRVTLAGVALRPEGQAAAHARAVYDAAVPAAAGGGFGSYGDFTYWVLRVERVRWVGGYGRMDSPGVEDYAGAEPDPVAPHAAGAVRHLNEDHADALLAMAQALAGFSDATGARCTRADRHGLDLRVATPRGGADTRVGFAEAVAAPDGLRAATVELARRARAS